MPKSLLSKWKGRAAINRRDLLKQGGMLSVAGALPALGAVSPTAVTGGGKPGDIYRYIGVEPVINARGTFTIITGSQSLPQVKTAMEQASHGYVQLDELMAGASKKLAELTEAPWGIVTNGCCAALTHFTAACLAGTNPERMQRLPNLEGLKDEVVIPSYSRNVYDHAIRMLGVKVLEVKDPAELEAAFNSQTALVYILAGPGDEGPLGTKVICDVAKRHNVPVIVDAAAEDLTIPNIHLQRGATAVAYSGGKGLRGPQAAGLLLGDRNLLEAAWANSAPHHAFGRSLKVGKEEIMGMLAAVEQWKQRDHQAEWNLWLERVNLVSARITQVPGVTAKILQPDSLSNRTPTLQFSWDGNQLGITGSEVAKLMLDSEPRIVVANGMGNRPDQMHSSVSVVPWMMMPGDEKIVADKLYAVLTNHPKFENPAVPQGQLSDVAGQWTATLEFKRGSAQHNIILEQHGGELMGTHQGEFVTGDLSGKITANQIFFRSSQRIQGQRLGYTFTGTVDGDKMAGVLNMGEYGDAKWTAERHQYRSPNGRPRPEKKA